MKRNYIADWYINVEDDEQDNEFAYLEESIHDDIRVEREMS